MSDKKGDDKKADKKADKKGGDDKKKGDAKPKADKKADGGDGKPKDDKKGGDKGKDKADKKGDDKKADKKADAKPKDDAKPKADAETKDAVPAAAAAGAADDKKGEKKAKKDKKSKDAKDEKADGAAKADGKDAPVVETELSHVDPNKPVEKPNKDQLDNDVKALEKVVKEIETTVTRLSQQLEAKNAERAKLRSSKNELFEEGKKIKESREKMDEQVRKLTTKIEEIIAERKNNRQRLDATAKSLRFTNLDELEKAIANTEMRIATSTLSLAAEKQLIGELKLLKAQRVEVAKFAQEKQKVNTANAAKTDELKAGDVRETRDKLRKEATALFKLEKEAFDKFSAAKAKDNELKRDCDALADKRRTNLKDKKTFLDKIYGMKREFVAADRAYYRWLQRQKKDKASANRARAREEPRASAGTEGAVGGAAPQQYQVAFVDSNRPAAGMGNRRAKKERAAGGDDDKPRKKKESVAGPDGDDDEPAVDEIEDLTEIVLFAAEKSLCDKLVRYLTQLQGKHKSADDAAAKDEKKNEPVLVEDRNKGFKGKPATVLAKTAKQGAMKLEDFFGKDVSKSQDIKPKKAGAVDVKGVIEIKGGADAKIVAATDKKAAARAAAKKQKLTHVPDVFTEFKSLGLTAPVEVGQLEASIKALTEKKAYYETNPVEADAAAGAAGAPGDAAEAPADGAALADKLMDEEKAARVKEADDLKAAAAKIAADDRKKAAKAADAAAEKERSRRVEEDAKAKKANADEENTERKRRKSLATEAEDAEQKRRVEEDAKAKQAAADEEAKTRATGRRNSLQAQDEEQKRRIAAGEDHHDKPSVVAQVDAAEKKGKGKDGKGKKGKDGKGKGAKGDDAKADAADAKAAAAPAKADAAPAAAAAAAPAAAAAGAATGAELVKKIDADLTKAGFEPFTNAPASS